MQEVNLNLNIKEQELFKMLGKIEDLSIKKAPTIFSGGSFFLLFISITI